MREWLGEEIIANPFSGFLLLLISRRKFRRRHGNDLNPFNGYSWREGEGGGSIACVLRRNLRFLPFGYYYRKRQK